VSKAKRRIVAYIPSLEGQWCYMGDNVPDVMEAISNIFEQEVGDMLGDDLHEDETIELQVKMMTDEEVRTMPEVP
jgi:hypothetical protein